LRSRIKVSELEASEVLGSSIHISGTVTPGALKFLRWLVVVGMSLRALTLCYAIKIVRVTRVDSWDVFPKFRSGLEYSNQTLHADRHYRATGAGSQELMAFCIGAVWKRGKIYGFVLSLHIVEFVLALHAAAQTFCVKIWLRHSKRSWRK